MADADVVLARNSAGCAGYRDRSFVGRLHEDGIWDWDDIGCSKRRCTTWRPLATFAARSHGRCFASLATGSCCSAATSTRTIGSCSRRCPPRKSMSCGTGSSACSRVSSPVKCRRGTPSPCGIRCCFALAAYRAVRCGWIRSGPGPRDAAWRDVRLIRSPPATRCHPACEQPHSGAYS
jgi:hypothetical protein